MSLGIYFDRETGAERKQRYPEEHGIWRFDEDDYLLYAMLCDAVYHAELLWENPANHDYGGCYVVWDYQYPLFRVGPPAPNENYAGFACARSVGKTESIKARTCVHAIKRLRMNLLLSAPELIHLLPLTDAIEDKIRSSRLLNDFLDTRGGKTGFTHRPFGIDFVDGTKIVGRIPRLTGTGVKGQHQPDLIIDEAQDYPERGWVEVHETVMKDTVDAEGRPDFTYHFYGVHSGAQDSGFSRRAKEGTFRLINLTAMQRPSWNKAEKDAAKAAYGGTNTADYRRNVLGEPGGAASPYFVTARLVACMDQDRDSRYNTLEVRAHGELHQLIKTEEFVESGLTMAETLDLPTGYKRVWGGMDVGLTESPSVILLFSEEKVGKVKRLKLIRRIHMERMRTRHQREALYAIANTYGSALQGFGIDITGLGFPMWQEMEDDENAPPRLMEVSTGYFFNAKVPVGVAKEHVTTDDQGRMRDQLGAQVTKDFDPLTGITRYVTHMPMIEASTRYLRELVDSTELMLPFDPEVIGDMQGETQQRVKRLAGLKNKPNAFHILDAMRAMGMKYREADVMEQLALEPQEHVLDAAL